MNADKYRELHHNLNQKEARLKSIRDANNPAELEELEATGGLLRFWESQFQAMAWNTENEDGSLVRVMDKPHKTALQIVGFEDRDLTTLMHFPATRRELLDKLQVKFVVFDDRIEIKAIFPIRPIYCQEFPSMKGLGGRVRKK